MYKISILLLFLLGGHSALGSTLDCESHRGFLLGTAETINELKLSMKLISANLKIKQILPDQETSEDDDANRCSSTRVSTSGHVLTAMHCLSECLESNSVFGTPSPTDQELKVAISSGNTDALPKARIKSRPQNSGTCKVNVAGYGLLDMKIVATGDCDQGTLRDRIQGLKKKDKELREKLKQMRPTELNHFIQSICPSDNDFVVIQSDQLKSDTQGCLAAAGEKPSQGKKIFVSGFPMETSREDGSNSDGKSLFISSGQIASQNFCTLYQSQDAIDREQKRLNAKKNSSSAAPAEMPQMNMSFKLEDMPKPRKLRPDEMVATRFDFTDILDKSDWSKTLTQVTADAVPGNSGGPLSNSDAEILGVASQIVKADGSIGWIGANTRAECRGATFFVPIHSIQEKIKSQTPAGKTDLSKEIFNCAAQSPQN